jgi:hypothetical protein
MDEARETGASPDDQAKIATRRPWHAPQFVVTDVASTYAQANGGHDGAGAAPSQS